MSNTEAKFILGAYRANGSDADDATFGAALAQARSDPALGAWFGWQAILPIILMSAVVGAAVGITLIVTGKKTMASRLPFGVYLAPAGVLMLFAGRQVIEWILPNIA